MNVKVQLKSETLDYFLGTEGVIWDEWVLMVKVLVDAS
jgi:hypothetical protein